MIKHLIQMRCWRSGWSSLGRTTFPWVVGLVPRLHRHPRVAKYTCIYDVQLLAIWRIKISAACSSSASQSSPTCRPIAETPHQPLSFLFPKQLFGKNKVVYRSFQPSWFASLHIVCCRPPPPCTFICSGLATFEMPVPPL